ncbi:MAG: glycosyltransferase, partial [Candidatus Andersenbacteria bacterium]
MRIAIDVRSLMEGRHSGVEEYTTHIIHALLRIAPQHEYILFYNSAHAVQLPPFAQPVTSVGLRYPNKVFKAAQWASRWPRWDTLISADCFFVPSLSLMPLQPQTPLVTTVHDLSFERFPEFFSLRRRLWHALMRPRALLQASHHLIAVSDSTATDIHKLYDIPLKKISVVHSGISLPAVR